MTRFFRIALSRHIVINALKVSVVVGSVLNLVNQGEACSMAVQYRGFICY